jgi:predicted naringenin-chalcone synthase
MPASTPVLHNFHVYLPRYYGTHEQTVQWLAAAHARSEATFRKDANFDQGAFRRQMERHIRRFGPTAQALGGRRSDINEFLDERFEDKHLFPLHRQPEGESLSARMDAFAEMADRAFTELYSEGETKNESPPDEILHVTCTGYASPSAGQKLIEKSGWHEHTHLTHIYHMGCYAALPAMRVASGFLASSPSQEMRCDLVHTEVCTLHLNPLRHDAEQLVVQSLFADGYIRYSLGKSGEDIESGFTVLGFLERLIPDSLEDIGWIPGNFGMRMTLSRNVPDKIALVLEPFLIALAAQCGCSREELQEAIYAVHPGGPRILDKVGEWLNLAPSQLAASREILFERGNMSSATLPHIWERLLQTPGTPSGTLVVSLAFGPGLTIYGSLMRFL